MEAPITEAPIKKSKEKSDEMETPRKKSMTKSNFLKKEFKKLELRLATMAEKPDFYETNADLFKYFKDGTEVQFGHSDLIEFFDLCKGLSFLSEKVLIEFESLFRDEDDTQHLNFVIKLVQLINLQKLKNRHIFEKEKKNLIAYINRYELNLGQVNPKTCQDLNIALFPWATSLAVNCEILQLLKQYNANIYAIDDGSFTALHHACLRSANFLKQFNELINFDVNKLNHEQRINSAYLAIKCKKLQQATILLANSTPENLNFLLNRILEKYPHKNYAVKFLLDFGADVGRSELEWAENHKEEHQITAQLIIEASVLKNEQQKKRWSFFSLRKKKNISKSFTGANSLDSVMIPQGVNGMTKKLWQMPKDYSVTFTSDAEYEESDEENEKP